MRDERQPGRRHCGGQAPGGEHWQGPHPGGKHWHGHPPGGEHWGRRRLMKRHLPLRKRIGLRFIMTLFVFVTLLVSSAIIGMLASLLVRLGVIDLFGSGRSPVLPFLFMLVASLLLSTLLTAMGSTRMLKPLRRVIEAMRAVAEGDFSVRLGESPVPEMNVLNCSFNKMAQELGSTETLRSDFVSNFSHEFKTPIVSIRGFAKLLKDEALPEAEREEYVDIIIQESERLAGLATNVLNLSKMENINILADKTEYSLDEQIRRVGALMEPRWKEKGLAVDTHMDAIRIYADEALLQEVWVNLLDNAIKFTDTGGQIAMTLKKDGEYAVFEIEDSGRGMDEETLARIFDKFYQADASRAGSGNGLGLSLVQRAVALSGGRVEAVSRPGVGSCFTVALPLGTNTP